MKKRLIHLGAVLMVLALLLPIGAQAAGKMTVSRANVAATGVVRLSWVAVSKATGYQISRATAKNGTYKALATVKTTSFDDSSATVGKTYYYKVKAVNKKGTTLASSDAVSAVRDLARPVVMLSNVASSGKIKISWETVKGASKYEVYRSTAKNGTYTRLTTTTKTSVTNTKVEAGQLYYYKVKAIHEKSAANSAFSAVKSRTCDLAQPEIKVSNVSSSGKIKISWETVKGASKYEVYRADLDGVYEFYGATAETVFAEEVESGQYSYKVRAIHSKSAANSAYSLPVTLDCESVGHDYMHEVTDPTCGSEGYTTYTCTVCGHTYRDEITAATEHLNTTTVTEAAFCGVPGSISVYCEDCDTRISCTIIPPPSDQHSYTVTKRLGAAAAALYEEKGDGTYLKYSTYEDWNVQVCAYCDDIDIDSKVFAYTDYETAEIMLEYINTARRAAGLREWKLDPTLIEVAKIQAIDYIDGRIEYMPFIADCWMVDGGHSISHHFEKYTNSVKLLDKNYRYVGYGWYWPYGQGSMYGVILHWTQANYDSYYGLD